MAALLAIALTLTIAGSAPAEESKPQGTVIDYDNASDEIVWKQADHKVEMDEVRAEIRKLLAKG